MLNYIKAEIYRAIKTKWYMALLLLMCLFIMGEVIYFLKSSELVDYFDYTMMFFKFVVLLVTISVTVLIYKRKDIKTELLSMGLSRENIFIRDWFSLQFITICSVFLLAVLGVLGGVIVKLFSNGDIDMITGFIWFIGKLLFHMININNGVLGLSYLLNNAALGAVSSFVIIPSIFQIIMFSTDGKIYDVANGFLSIQAFKLMEIGLDSGTYLFNESLLLAVVSFSFTLIAYLLTGFIRFRYSELN